MKKCMRWLVLGGLLFGIVGCGRDSPADKDKTIMVIPPGGIPVNPLQKTMPYQWQYQQWQKQWKPG
jgi:hypothetical protein